MPSLTSLVDAHGLVLLVDSTSSSIQVGLLERPTGGQWWQRSPREAGTAIFEGVAGVLADAGAEIRQIGAFVCCEGPGSILGIRTAAVAMRTWRATIDRPVATYAYHGLQLVARDLADAGRPPPFAVIADARRDTWHLVEGANPPAVGPVRRVTAAELAEYPGALFTPEGFRAWSRPPRPADAVPYELAELWARQGGADLLHAAPEPDAFLLQDTVYTPWTPQVHRAPRPRTP